MHPLLEQQLRLYADWPADAPLPEPATGEQWWAFLAAIERAYVDADGARTALQHAVDVSAREMSAAIHDRDVAATTAGLLKRDIETRMAELESILGGAPHPILMTDPEGRILRASTAVEATLGWMPEELQGRSIAEIIPAALDYWTIRARRENAYAKLRSEGEAPGPIVAELTATRRDGEEIPVEVTLVDIDDAERGYRIVAERVDLTARRHAERQARVLQKSEALGTLVAGVAHDFNKILTIISGAFTAATTDSPDHDRWIEIGRRNTDRAIALVASLLRFARRTPGTTSTIDMSSITLDTIRMLREMLDRKITFEASDIEVDLPAVVGDQNELQQVLVNLVLNARDAVLEQMDAVDAAYEPTIEVSLRQVVALGLPAVQVEVRDNGGGIPRELIDRVFDPFFTTKPVGKGTGLGLSMAFSMIRGHGGEISIDSVPGGGSTVRFWLPADVAPVLETMHQTADNPAEWDDAAPVDGSDWRVLAVDDEPNLLDLIQFVFAPTNADVTTVGDAQRAVREVEMSTFDVALVDVNMPGVDGWRLMEQLRAVDPTLPIVMVSGYLDAIALGQHEPAAAIAKPYDARELLQTVHRVITEHPRHNSDRAD